MNFLFRTLAEFDWFPKYFLNCIIIFFVPVDFCLLHQNGYKSLDLFIVIIHSLFDSLFILLITRLLIEKLKKNTDERYLHVYVLYVWLLNLTLNWSKNFYLNLFR